jgi:hypothetical protein
MLMEEAEETFDASGRSLYGRRRRWVVGESENLMNEHETKPFEIIGVWAKVVIYSSGMIFRHVETV